MTIWLHQQESIHQFALFLKWAAPCDEDSVLMLNADEELGAWNVNMDEQQKDRMEVNDVDRTQPDADKQTQVTQTQVTHHVTRRPRWQL